jgi:polyhydroxybutyrate depolymerase
MARVALYLLVGLGLNSPGESAEKSDGQVPTPGTYKVKTDQRAAGFRRTYLLHVPEGYDAGTPLPLVVAIHGAFRSGKNLERRSGLSRLADRERFVVVYPNGIGLFGMLRHWNSGHCCGKARKDDIDDVGFVTSVIEEVSRRLRVDSTRIYLVGYSNGGMLAYRIAAEKSKMIAAFSAVAATIGGKPKPDIPEWVIPRPERPVPVVVFHGRADQNVPYDGAGGEQDQDKATSISVTRSVSFWVERNGCDPDPTTSEEAAGRVVRQYWEGCNDDADVALYTLEGWKHDWPGPARTDKLDEDDPLYGFDAAEIIWEFLRRHRRDAGLAVGQAEANPLSHNKLCSGMSARRAFAGVAMCGFYSVGQADDLP